MKSRLTVQFVLSVCMLMSFCASVRADTLSSSTSWPAIDDADIYQLAYASMFLDSVAPQVSEVWADKPVQGQSFTTGSNPGGYLLNAITLACNNGILDGRTFNVQVGTFHDNGDETGSLVPIATYSTSTGSGLGTGFVTMTLSAPLALGANTHYGFDWSSTWSGGMILWNSYQSGNDNPYSGGGSYWSGANGVPDNNNLSTRTYDRVFHLDLTAVSLPEPTTLLMLATGLIGLLAYAWRKRR